MTRDSVRPVTMGRYAATLKVDMTDKQQRVVAAVLREMKEDHRVRCAEANLVRLARAYAHAFPLVGIAKHEVLVEWTRSTVESVHALDQAIRARGRARSALARARRQA
jgi:hypothetical protein